MKKTSIVILMLCLALTYGFATGTGNGDTDLTGKNSLATPKTCELSLTLSHSQFAFQRIGFCDANASGLAGWTDPDDINPSTGIPSTDKASVTIEKQKEGTKADNTGDPLYFYYKIRNSASLTLKITGSALVNDGSYINYTIGNTTTENSAESIFVNKSLSAGYNQGCEQISIVTEDLKGSMVKDTAYTATLTMNVIAG